MLRDVDKYSEWVSLYWPIEKATIEIASLYCYTFLWPPIDMPASRPCGARLVTAKVSDKLANTAGTRRWQVGLVSCLGRHNGSNRQQGRQVISNPKNSNEESQFNDSLICMLYPYLLPGCIGMVIGWCKFQFEAHYGRDDRDAQARRKNDPDLEPSLIKRHHS